MRTIPSKLYDKEYFLTKCGGFEEFLKGGICQRLLYALSLVDLEEGMSVLDVGAGRGEIAIKCAEAGAYVKAIDYSQAAIEIARESLKRVDKKIAERVVFEKMNAKKISYPDKSFDAVFMIDVVEHLYPEELRRGFLEIKRVLKPGGRVIIHTGNFWLLKPFYFLARIFLRWRKQELHVNEQNFFSLHHNLRPFGGKIRIFFRPRKKYFFGAVHGVRRLLPFWAVSLASFLDKLWENTAISFLIYHTPLALFLGTDLWAIVEVPKKNRLSK